MANAFQKNLGFQSNAFQGAVQDIVRGGGGYYDGYWDRVKEALHDKEKRRIELQMMERKLSEEKEVLRLKEEKFLQDRVMSVVEAQELQLLEARIAQLTQMQAILIEQIRFIMREEDDLIVLLYSMPFCL